MANKKKTNLPQKQMPVERRKAAAPDDKALYRHKNLPGLAKQERRKDMLARLREVQDQRRLWLFVVTICLGMNLLLVGLGLWGWLQR